MKNVEVLRDEEVMRQVSNILKTNIRACQSAGHPYISQV